MISIDNLIYNTLLTGERVYLPKAGTLGISRQGARQPDHKEVVAPSATLTFSARKEFGAVGVLALIAIQEGVEEGDKAKEMYNKWFAKAKTGDTLVIDGVGSISGGTVSIDSELYSLLNPQYMKGQSQDEETGSGRKWLWTIGIILLMALLLLCAYWAGLFSPRAPRPTVVQVADTTAVAADSITCVPAAPKMAKFYVVTGVFRIESNAEARVKSAGREFPSMTIEKTQMPDGRFMVSIFSGDMRSDAQRVVNRYYYSVNNELWIWENK